MTSGAHVPNRKSPSGPRVTSGGGIIQAGYDQTMEVVVVPPTGPGTPPFDGIIFPRSATEGLSVHFPSVTPGNYLEISYQIGMSDPGSEGDPPPGPFATVAVVSFDGSPLSGYPTGYYEVSFIAGGGWVELTGTDTATATGAILIPDDAVSATVAVYYSSPITLGTIGPAQAVPLGVIGPSAQLQVKEIPASIVTQTPPTVLEPALPLTPP